MLCTDAPLASVRQGCNAELCPWKCVAALHLFSAARAHCWHHAMDDLMYRAPRACMVKDVSRNQQPSKEQESLQMCVYLFGETIINLPLLKLFPPRRVPRSQSGITGFRGSGFYKVCNLKPLTGRLFPELIGKGTDWWGFCDADIILGDMSIIKKKLSHFDSISPMNSLAWGPFHAVPKHPVGQPTINSRQQTPQTDAELSKNS